jgi:hypothetical protein
MAPRFTVLISDGTLNLMRHVLRELDRGVLETLGYTAARHGQSHSERRRIRPRSRKLKSRSANHCVRSGNLRLHKFRNGRRQDSLKFFAISLDLVFFLAL